MKKIFLLILIAIFTISCSNKNQYTIEDIWEDFTFNRTVSNSTQIIINVYDSTLTTKRFDAESYILKAAYKTKTKKEVEDFDKIFVNVEKTDYCCCPKIVYLIHFLNQKKEIDVFCVDTTEFKNKVRIFEGSYQFSYIIEKQKWKDYLKEIEN
jgi:hypothetical protein